ncbi:D-alanyl-D-alanine carboxypeptidase family protein [Alteribacillus sp. YIM 98480]|uniref:D-alanyl-D-alanine carboxypeptidase family protein n=1 Tax=Alteribacillus sp. YIM 98480 TaxID=2606599 RepID=UPI00131B5EB4|nr:D-alanyl-D-alanine carboxypeptidase family protein [Alteribacillus sp. YIM 98480]
MIIHNIHTVSLIQAEDEDTAAALSLHSESAVLMDANTGQLLYDKAGDEKMYPASITKIATGIMAVEKGFLEDKVTVSKEAVEVEGTSVYLLEGEEMELKQLIQGMMINSGNDASAAVAEHISGSQEAFSKEMTRYLEKKTGIENTSFTNPHGLHGTDHYSTAEDMAKITSYAMNNDIFRDIVGTKEMHWKGEGWETELRNHHQLLWDYEGANGVKNGYVSEAGFTLVTSANREGRELIAVVMKAGNSTQAYQDTTELLNLGFDTFEEKHLEKGARYQAPDGTSYIVPDSRPYSVRKEVELDFQMNNNGQLTIADETGRTIFATYLPQEKGKASPEKKSNTKSVALEEESSDEGGKEMDQSYWKSWPDSSYFMADIMNYQLKHIFNFSNLQVKESS